MKVARYRAHGGPENIELAEQPDPSPKAGEVLVRVRASSVNPVDWKAASGAFPFNLIKPGLPYIPGRDIAGEVVRAAGPFQAGDRVFAVLPRLWGGGSAELAVIDAGLLAKMPPAMAYAEAAAIPLAALTALQGLGREARMPLSGASGYRVLVIGASGGVGHYGVQIARAAGAHVTGVCSGPNRAMVEGLGARAVIDYTKPSEWNAEGDYDVILDCVGEGPIGRFTRWLTPRGVYVSTLPNAGLFARQLASTLALRRRVRGVVMRPVAADLGWLADAYEAGRLRSHLDETFPLSRLSDAHRRSMSGRVRGKLVIDIDG